MRYAPALRVSTKDQGRKTNAQTAMPPVQAQPETAAATGPAWPRQPAAPPEPAAIDQPEASLGTYALGASRTSISSAAASSPSSAIRSLSQRPGSTSYSAR